ncbi:fimbrial biogenesis outer membrane usher protein [Symbiopectobacterium purcellii]|uniref:CS1-pili formation C-terminal domain-containing protein n=1 Tax=Symbiopectobacterium purcellii TaxID=2871826 RepID=A0ABX9AKT9_9ENTR|nr:CS1-pili formation C-terminal domain-containing protein [Symbiopectobacterium purcellii]
MYKLQINIEIKKIVISMMVLFSVAFNVAAAQKTVQQIGGVMIPHAFRNALLDGMSIPLFIHLDGSAESQNDQRIGNAVIWLDGDTVKVKLIHIEEKDDTATVNEKTRHALAALTDAPFNENLEIKVVDDAWLKFNLKQLILQLVVRQEALGTLFRPRSEDIGNASVDALSSTLNYNLGVYNNQMRNGGDNTSSYLSLNNVTALREHHMVLDGAFYGMGSSHRDSTVYKAMYERDFGGYRFAAGMLDTWNLQSLGPMTALSSGKIYGASWGNAASSTVFDNSQSATPIVVFLSAAGEVHISREGRLLSVQNFGMGSHEVDTRGLPYGIYDVDVAVVVNGRMVSRRVERVNKLFTRGRATGAPLGWQIWGGSMHMERWYESGKKTKPAKDTYLLGGSLSGSAGLTNWSATGYGYDSAMIGEGRVSVPITESIGANLQQMVANDSSVSSIGNVTAALPGGFSSLWVNIEKASMGDDLRRNDADNRAIGGTLNMNVLWSKLGILNVSYNDDRHNDSNYYNVDYSQMLYSGSRGTLGLRMGIQSYQNGYSNGYSNNGSSNGYSGSSSNTGRYIALDFSMPLGNWFSAGTTHQNGYTMANLSARKQFNDGAIRTVGANVSRAISGDTGDDKSLSGGAYTQFDTKYSAGTLNVNSSADGYVNTNLTAKGSVGVQGNQLAASGRTDGNAGIIFKTDVADDGKLSAKVNGRTFQLDGKRNYLPLSPYSRYEIEIQNSKDAVDSYDIVTGRKRQLTLYPGNVAVIEPEIKQRVTVFGRIRAEDGSLLANARINNHIGRTSTDENGEFVIDVDKKYPVIDYSYGNNQRCEAELDLSKARGAVWVGDVICIGLSRYASNLSSGEYHEG